MGLPFDISAEQAMNKSGRIGVCRTDPALIRNAYMERLMTSIPIPRFYSVFKPLRSSEVRHEC